MQWWRGDGIVVGCRISEDPREVSWFCCARGQGSGIDPSGAYPAIRSVDITAREDAMGAIREADEGIVVTSVEDREDGIVDHTVDRSSAPVVEGAHTGTFYNRFYQFFWRKYHLIPPNQADAGFAPRGNARRHLRW
jgi:hypothetical protein